MKKSVFIVLCGVLPMLIMAQNTTVKDCQGHVYPVVKIGNQVWMAENLQCTKYDTQSERAGAGLSSIGKGETPYYADIRYDDMQESVNLTNEQRNHLGLLYTWIAAIGYVDMHSINQAGSNNGRRQGICPNGWHIPSKAEWDSLRDYIAGNKLWKPSEGLNVGTHLKTTNGWLKGDGYMEGDNISGFSALPAGNNGRRLGEIATFWASDARYNIYYLVNNKTYFGCDGHNSGDLCSVRCIKN